MRVVVVRAAGFGFFRGVAAGLVVTGAGLAVAGAGLAAEVLLTFAPAGLRAVARFEAGALGLTAAGFGEVAGFEMGCSGRATGVATRTARFWLRRFGRECGNEPRTEASGLSLMQDTSY